MIVGIVRIQVLIQPGVHDQGLWSSAPRDRQIHGLIEFYNSICRDLGPSYRSQIPVVSRYCFELGVLKRHTGKYAEAVEYLVTSVRLCAFTSEIPRGRRLWHLARLGICGLLGLGFTPREVASAVIRSARLTRSLWRIGVPSVAVGVMFASLGPDPCPMIRFRVPEPAIKGGPCKHHPFQRVVRRLR